MAARKLKFKPKPVVGGAVRRQREKEEIPEITTQENIASCNNIQNERNSGSSDHIFCEENVSKRMRIEQAEKTIVAPPTEFDNKTFDFPCSLVSDLVDESKHKTATTTSNKPSETNDRPNDSNIDKIINIEPVSTQSSESSITEFVPPSTSPEFTGGKREENSSPNIEINSPSITNLSQESGVDEKSAEKTGVTKGMPRIGRSKFKPVLINSARKKTEMNCNTTDNQKDESKVCPVSVVRTESVIKCANSETNASSIVSEITDSFSALESEEPEPLQSLATENDSLKQLSQFDHGNKDVQATTNESSSSNKKVHFINTNKSPHEVKESGSSNLLPSKVRDQVESDEPNQMSETVHNSETSNSNALLSSASKVPVSPLKLASKILVPKPCPNLLDTAVRRISFHGSDSEEESKRKVLKNNKLGKKTIKEETDLKNSKRKLSQGSTYSKLGQEALEKFTQKFGKVERLEPTDKAKLTMLDLIFYNPKSNPMSVSTEQTVIRKKEDKFEINSVVRDTLAEQAVDDVEEKTSAQAVPVPQLKVGPDGQIILDPNSLVIETTEVKEKRAEMEKSEVIRETGITRYNTYSKKKHTRKDWSAQETLQFYKALNTIGSDFTLMTKLFPKRSRHELKLKFKKEEKTNLKLVDLAMTAPTDFDFSSLEEEMRRENEEIARREEEKRLAVEEARKARAQRKEDRVKNKYPKSMRVQNAAFKSFDEAEKEVMRKVPGRKRTKRNKKRVVKKQSEIVLSSSDEEDEPITIDLDSDEADLDESEMKLLKMIREKSRPGRKGRKVKQTKKLEEYEEINETLKRKLEEIDSDLSDGYTPNGPGADMLFGSPARDPLSDVDEAQWNMEVSEAPNNADESQLSELKEHAPVTGLSPPEVSSAQEFNHSSRLHTGSVLNRHLISESIQIIDQLTSTEHLNFKNEITSERTNEDRDPADQELSGNQIPLPSFESVSCSRLPVVYSVQEPCASVQAYENSDNICGKSNLSTTTEETDQHFRIEKDNSQGEIVLPDSYIDSEECVLGD